MIKGFAHVGITVRNLEESVRFYCDILGFQLLNPIGDRCCDPEELACMGVEGKAGYRCVLIKTPAGLIEMFDYDHPSEGRVADLPSNSIGKLHLAFTVENVDEEVEKLKAHGIRFYGEPRMDVLDTGKIKWVYFRDPNGITLEFVQRF